MRLRRVVAMGIAVLGLAAPEHAFANGRFPRAQRLTEVQGDTNTLLLSATYGILLTTDRGGTWGICVSLGLRFRSMKSIHSWRWRVMGGCWCRCRGRSIEPRLRSVNSGPCWEVAGARESWILR